VNHTERTTGRGEGMAALPVVVDGAAAIASRTIWALSSLSWVCFVVAALEEVQRQVAASFLDANSTNRT
jgi:hypothetical protein